MYHPHPSLHLQACFRSKPYQGALPEQSRFVFVGLDANYAADIEASDMFAGLLQYHDDGPGFWRSTGVHHPFLLPSYKGDGRRYHRTFSKIGFQPKHAHLVSFVELLDVPTCGRSALTVADLNPKHIDYLRMVVLDSKAELIFLSAGVQNLLLKTGKFPELASVQRECGGLRVLYEDDNRTIFLHLHFSNYGKFEQQLQQEQRGIAALLAASEA